MVEGRSKHVFKSWLAARDKVWRDGVEVVAMDGFTGFKTAAAEELTESAARPGVTSPMIQTQLFGLAHDFTVNDSYGMSVYTGSGWKSWTDSNFLAPSTVTRADHPYGYFQYYLSDHGHYWTDDV